jgi:hypothetical protein
MTVSGDVTWNRDIIHPVTMAIADKPIAHPTKEVLDGRAGPSFVGRRFQIQMSPESAPHSNAIKINAADSLSVDHLNIVNTTPVAANASTTAVMAATTKIVQRTVAKRAFIGMGYLTVLLGRSRIRNGTVVSKSVPDGVFRRQQFSRQAGNSRI